MAADSIGSVSVQIVGDYSGLNADIAEGQQIAAAGAKTMKDTLEGLANDANTSIEKLVDQLVSGTLKAKDFVSTLNSALDSRLKDEFELDATAATKLAQNLEKAGADFLQFGTDVQTAIPPLEQLGKDANQAGNDAAKSGDQFRAFGDGLKDIGTTLSASLTVPLAAISAALIKVGTDFDEASDTIRAKTGLVGQDLEAMNKSFDALAANLPNKLGDITTAMVTLETRAHLTGPALEAMATQLLNLSRITGEQIGPLTDAATKAFARWNIATADQAAALDKLYIASTQTGTSVNTMLGTLQRFAPALQEVGFSFEQAAALIAKFEQAGLNTQRDITALQQAILKLGKAGIADPIEGLQLLIDRIKNAGSTGEANAIGLKVFGRGALDMVDAVRSGKLGVDDLVKSMEGSSGAIKKAADDTLSFADKVKQLANQLGVALRPAAESFLTVMEDVIRDLKPAIQVIGDLAKGFHDLEPGTQKAIIGVGGFIALSGPMVIAAGAMASQLGKLITLFGAEGALEGVAGAATAARTAVTGFIGSMAGLTAGTLTAGIVATISNLNDLKGKWDDVAQASKNAFILDAVSHGKTIDDLKKIGVSLEDVKKAFQGSAIAVTETGAKYDDFGVKVSVAGKNATDSAKGVDSAATAARGAAQATDAAKAALDRLLTGDGPSKQYWKNIEDSYKHFQDQLKEGTAGIGNTLAIASDLFTGSSRTIIGAFKEQGDALAAFTQRAASLAGESDDTIKTFYGHLKDLSPAVTDLQEKLGHFPSLAEQIAAGFTVIASRTDQTRDAYGNLKGAAASAYQALVDGGKNSVEIVTDFSQAVSASGSVLSSFGSTASSVFTSLDAQIKQMNEDFKDWASGVGSFSAGGESGGAKGKKGAGGTFSLSNPYEGLSPEEAQQSYNQLQSSFGGSAFNDFSAASFFLAQQRKLLDAALQDYYKANPPSSAPAGGQQSGPATTPGAPAATVVAAAPQTTSIANILPPEIQYALSHGATADQIATLTTSNQDLTNTLDKTNATFASLAPAVDTATAQLTQAVQQQSASFQNLSAALAPTLPAAPNAQVSNGTPGSFQRISNTTQTTGGITYNIAVTSPSNNQIAQSIITQLQRTGSRT